MIISTMFSLYVFDFVFFYLSPHRAADFTMRRSAQANQQPQPPTTQAAGRNRPPKPRGALSLSPRGKQSFGYGDPPSAGSPLVCPLLRTRVTWAPSACGSGGHFLTDPDPNPKSHSRQPGPTRAALNAKRMTLSHFNLIYMIIYF